MFKQPFTLKSSSVLKKTDRNALVERVRRHLFLDESTMNKVLARNLEVSVARILTYHNYEINVYSVDKRAILFEYPQLDFVGRNINIDEKRIIPTVYYLWDYPDLAYSFVVYNEVVKHILTGAHLMMPGVLKARPLDCITYFRTNEVSSVLSAKNKMPVAVGLTAMCGHSGMGGQKGKVMNVLHYHGDFLCLLYDQPLLPIPILRLLQREERQRCAEDFIRRGLRPPLYLYHSSESSDEDDPYVEPQDVKIKVEPQDVKVKVEPQDVKIKVEPQDVKIKVEPQDVKIKVEPQDVNLPSVSQDVKIKLEPHDVKIKLEPLDVTFPLESEDLQPLVQTDDMQPQRSQRKRVSLYESPGQPCPRRSLTLHSVQSKRIDEDIMSEVTAAIKALSLDESGALAEFEPGPSSSSKFDGSTPSKPSVELPHVAVDAALQRCFMTVAKYSPTLQLPQLTSSFYKMEMVQMMSDQLDIKASSYKKVSEFLKTMQKEGLCRLGQKQKGVDTVEEVHYSHKRISAFYLPVESRPKVVEEACATGSTKLNDTYMVVPEVVDIFLPKYRVGAKLTLSSAKKSIIDYIKKNGLQDIEKEYILARTPILQRLSPPGSTRVPNEELLQTVLSIMEDGTFKAPHAPCTSASVHQQTRLSRPVRMQVQTHSGKTVTIISNLQDYSNVHLTTFAKEVQVIAAASAKVIKETRQIQVQGNQVEIIGTLLNNKYGISKSKMIGLELAPKLKKCKH